MIYSKEEQQLLQEKYNNSPTPEFEVDRERLLAGEPLAYVIGTMPFCHTTIHLDSKPLIPRVESEYWLEQALAETDPEPKKVLDLFAGSGALGVAWAKHRPQDTITFGELEATHLPTIEKNITQNNISNRTALVQTDIFSNISEQFDIILANPPYIPKDRDLPKGVIDYEPLIALFAGVDGLIYIRTLISELPNHLTKGGVLYLEHDNTQAQEIQNLFPDTYTVTSRTDQYGIPRYTVAHYR